MFSMWKNMSRANMRNPIRSGNRARCSILNKSVADSSVSGIAVSPTWFSTFVAQPNLLLVCFVHAPHAFSFLSSHRHLGACVRFLYPRAQLNFRPAAVDYVSGLLICPGPNSPLLQQRQKLLRREHTHSPWNQRFKDVRWTITACAFTESDPQNVTVRGYFLGEIHSADLSSLLDCKKAAVIGAFKVRWKKWTVWKLCLICKHIDESCRRDAVWMLWCSCWFLFNLLRQFHAFLVTHTVRWGM